MLPRLQDLLASFDGVLEQINVREVSLDTSLEQLCPMLWAGLEGSLKACAVLEQSQTLLLLEHILRWGYHLNEAYPLRRKFSGSFGSTKVDREGVSFSELKRSVGQVFCIKAMTIVFKVIPKMIDDRMPMEALRYVEMVMNEVHCLALRRPCYVEPIRGLLGQLSQMNLNFFINYVHGFLRLSGKAPFLDLFIECLAQVRLAIYPAESLDMTLTLLEILVGHYIETKGQTLRDAYGHALYSMLTPLIEPVSAEVNLPKWEKIFVKMLLKRTFSLCEKQKYRPAAIKLASSTLCLCDKDTFQQKWHGLADAISTFIREGTLTKGYFLIVLQLIWTQVHKYPEAYATQSANLLKLLTPYTPPKNNARKLPFDMNVIFSTYLGIVAVLAIEQPQFVLRDMVLPLLEGADGCTTVDAFPTSRVTLAILALLVLGSTEKSSFPTRLVTEFEVPALCDSFIHYKPDMIISESLEKIKMMVGKAFVTLDSLIFDPSTVYDLTAKAGGTISSGTTRSYHSHAIVGDHTPQECTPRSTLYLIMAVVPVINLKMKSPLQQLQLLLQYVAHPDEFLAETAFNSFQAILNTALMACTDISLMNQLYCVYSKQIDRIPDRHLSCLTRAASLFPLILAPLLQIIDDDTNEGLIMDIASKIILFSLSISSVVVEMVNEKVCALSHPLLEPLLRIVGKQGRTDHQEMILELHSTCPGMCQQARVNLMSRVQEIQAIAASGRLLAEEDSLVQQWGNYLEFLFRFGPPTSDLGSTSQRRADASKLLRYLTFSRSDGGSSSGNRRELFTFLRSTIQQAMLIENNEILCSKLIESVRTLNPAFIGEIFDALEGLFGSVSKDLRNVEYQFVRKNRKQDALKVDLTRFLASIIPAIKEAPDNAVIDPNFGPHRILQRYIVETFYFCSEIDADALLPSLRIALATLIQEYHEIISGLPNRYEFFPFKLQTELFIVFRKWYDQRRLDHVKEQGGRSLESTTEINAPITQTIIPGDAEETFARCLGSLCRGLLSPLPVYRQESIPSSQVLRWIDSLIGKSWGPPLIRQAVRNLLLSCGGSIVEKVVQKVFQTDVVTHYPELSNSYFIALGETILLMREDKAIIDLPHKTIISLVALASLRGSEETRLMAKRLVVAVLKGKNNLNPEGADQISLVNAIDLEHELVRALPDLYAVAAGEIIAELSMRMEYLLLSPSPIKSSVLSLMANWLHRVILLPGQDQKGLLLNLCLLTLRLDQVGHDAYVLWDSLVALWRGNMLNILQIWMDLIFCYRKASLLHCSRQLFRHLSSKNRSVLCDCLVLMIDARQSLTPPIFPHTSYVPYIDRDVHASGQIVTRLEGFLQTSDKNSIDEQLTVGHVLVLWLAEIKPSVPLHPILEHVDWLLDSHEGEGDSSTEERLVPVNGQIRGEGSLLHTEESLWILLQWATECPIREYSLRSWQRFAEIVSQLVLPPSKSQQIILVAASFLRRVALAESSSPSTPLIVQAAVAELSSATILSLANLAFPVDGSNDVGEALGKLCLLMASCDMTAVYGAALNTLGALTGRLPIGGILSPPLTPQGVRSYPGLSDHNSSTDDLFLLDRLSLTDLVMVTRGYGDESTCPLTVALLCHLIHRQYRAAEAQTETNSYINMKRLIPLLVALIPGLIRETATQTRDKMFMETLSMLCNLFEASLVARPSASSDAPDYRLVIRILQTWGRRKRPPADSVRELAMLFCSGPTGSESVVAPYTSLLIIGLVCRLRAASKDAMTRDELYCIVTFMESWLSGISHDSNSRDDGKVERAPEAEHSSLWIVLLEAVVAALHYDSSPDEQAVHRLLALLTGHKNALPPPQPADLPCPLPFAMGHNMIADTLSSCFISPLLNSASSTPTTMDLLT